MAEPMHQLLCAGAGRGGHRSRDVAKVVEVNAIEAECSAGASPLALPHAQAQRTASYAGEYQASGSRCSPTLKVQLRLGYQPGGQHQHRRRRGASSSRRCRSRRSGRNGAGSGVSSRRSFRSDRVLVRSALGAPDTSGQSTKVSAIRRLTPRSHRGQAGSEKGRRGEEHHPVDLAPVPAAISSDAGSGPGPPGPVRSWRSGPGSVSRISRCAPLRRT